MSVPFKGILERGYRYLGGGIDVDMDIHSDVAASISWGSFEKGFGAPLKRCCKGI